MGMSEQRERRRQSDTDRGMTERQRKREETERHRERLSPSNYCKVTMNAWLERKEMSVTLTCKELRIQPPGLC